MFNIGLAYEVSCVLQQSQQGGITQQGWKGTQSRREVWEAKR